MDRAQLLQHFDALAETPEAVEKLRKLILDFAIRGRLVPQNPKDEPAGELIRKIKAENKRLVQDDGAKAQKPLPSITPEEEPYELPSGWVWERLGNIGETNIGLTYSPQDISNVGIPVLRSSNVQNGRLDLSDLVRVDVNVKESVLVSEGDLLICARNGSRALVGKTALIDQLHEKTAFGAFMAIFRSSLNNYLYHFIRSPLFRRVIADVNTTTINQITQGNLRSTLAPIPPLAEQRRIVAKVEELLALCDALEAAQTAAREHRTHLVRSALDHLTTGVRPSPVAATSARATISESSIAHRPHHAAAPEDGRTPSAFRRHAAFVLNQFPGLTAAPEDVPALRQAINSLAVQGRLMPQNGKDETATRLLERIKSEKAKLIRQRDLRTEAPAAEIKGDERTCSLPENWLWVRLGETLIFTNGFSFESKDYQTTGVGLVRIGDIQNGEILSSDMKFVPSEFLTSIDSKFQVRPGDLLIAMSGATTGKLGFNRTNETFMLNQRVGKLEFVLVEAKYAYIYLSTMIQENLRISSGSAIPNLSTIQINETPFPLPPLAEQQRIVAKVDELLRWCDALEARLTAARSTATHLLDATLARLL